MSTVLSLFPARVRFVDANGLLTKEALAALAALFVRVGGAVGPSTTDLAVAEDEDSGLEEFRAEQSKHNDATDMQPPVVFTEFTDPLYPLQQEHVAVDALLTELAGLREEVAALRSELNGIQQGTML